MTRIGILSDTHMTATDDFFSRQCAQAFSGCEIILHAGDLCDVSILSAFSGKHVHAVCGNMCNSGTRLALPEKKHIIIDGYSIGLTHGAGPRHNIEERVFGMFSEMSCIVYGHTHIPVCHTIGTTLFINPGSFQSTGKYGAVGTYAILHIDHDGISGTIHSLAATS